MRWQLASREACITSKSGEQGRFINRLEAVLKVNKPLSLIE